MNRCKSQKADCRCPRCTRGWFSRRHETDDANRAARDAYERRAEFRPAQRWNAALGRWEKTS